MLTVYSHKSSFKKKITVVVIWSVALALSFLLIKMMFNEGISFLTKVLPLVLGLFMIAGILLRCKIARGFTLVTLYFLALFPLIANFLSKGSYLLFATQSDGFFTQAEVWATNVLWAIFFIIPIYFFSNNKSMEIFYIQWNPLEHVLFMLGAIGLCVSYIYLLL
jgi:hypothetical protein